MRAVGGGMARSQVHFMACQRSSPKSRSHVPGQKVKLHVRSKNLIEAIIVMDQCILLAVESKSLRE
jgi:hypothetical protein